MKPYLLRADLEIEMFRIVVMKAEFRFKELCEPIGGFLWIRNEVHNLRDAAEHRLFLAACISNKDKDVVDVLYLGLSPAQKRRAGLLKVRHFNLAVLRAS